jgi:2-isopropylmalate synthase
MTHSGTTGNTQDRIVFFDTTLRDGEQSPGCSMCTPEKIEMAHALDDLGVDILEAGFAISSEGDFQAIRAVSQAIRRPVIASLARARTLDVERAAHSLELAARPRIHTFLASSDLHLEVKLKISRQQALDHATAAVRLARTYVDDVEFSAEDATRSDIDFLAQLVAATIEAGATTINLPDTVGYSTPDDYAQMFREIRKRVPAVAKITLSAHCHDDLGMAVANSLAAIEGGVRQIECTINGIGERAGNTSIEEVVMILKTHHSLGLHTNIRSERIYDISRMVSNMMRMPVQPNKAIVGSNAFAHSSGIHQDGFLKMRENYEIIKPQDVGFPSATIVLTARSGRAALNHHLERLGYKLDKEELAEAYHRFLTLADNKLDITDDDLKGLVVNSMVKG